jgi:hypothetical protein
MHDGGIVSAPGVYLMGMQFLRRRKSALIDGAGDDARISAPISQRISTTRPAAESLITSDPLALSGQFKLKSAMGHKRTDFIMSPDVR